jgi:hypothetical protein
MLYKLYYTTVRLHRIQTCLLIVKDVHLKAVEAAEGRTICNNWNGVNGT